MRGFQNQPQQSGSRKRRRSAGGLFLQAVFVAVVLLPVASSFVQPFSATVRAWSQRNPTALVHASRSKLVGGDKKKGSEKKKKSSEKKKGLLQVVDKKKGREDDKDHKKRWMQWMVTGSKPRGTHKVSSDRQDIRRVRLVILRISRTLHLFVSLARSLCEKQQSSVASLAVIVTRVETGSTTPFRYHILPFSETFVVQSLP